MRPGLLIVGIVIAVVGAAVLSSIFFLPSATTETRLGSVYVPQLGPGQSYTSLVEGTNVSSGTLIVGWTATDNVSVQVYRTAPCSAPIGVCATGPPVVRWASNVSGHWSTTEALSFPMIFAVTDPGQVMISLQGIVFETYQVGGVPTWAVLALIAGGGVLVGIGGLAVFLGLFLRGGIYPRPDLRDAPYPDDLDDFGEVDDDDGDLDPIGRPPTG